MMRSLFSGISGLRNHQTRMDVIGNNIANVNTAGYKTARVIFQDIFSQNIADGMANQGNIGGTNPMQVGLGIRLSTVDIIHSRATFQRTDKETDMMINGDGFFIVGQINPETGQYETFYTRAGNFDLDNEGYLVTSQGFYVMGRTYELEMGVIHPGNEAIPRRDMIPANFYPRPGATPAYSMPPGDPNNPNNPGPFRVGDVIPGGTFVGAEFDGDITVTALNIDALNYRAPGEELIFRTTTTGDPGEEVTTVNQRWPEAALAAQPFVPARAPVFGLVPSDEYLVGDENGLTRIRALADLINLPEDPVTRLPIGYPLRTDDPDEYLDPTPTVIDGEETTVGEANYLRDLNAWILDQRDINGTREVGLPGLGVADNGDISVIVGNRKVVIGRIAVAMFANPAGLETVGNSLYRQTASSGQVVITEAFADGAGKIEGGGLEMSNVDLANEFTDMIVTQRGFQANSRIISVTDTMLEELVNLKR